jgi:predicted transposase YbfD/YdcC
VTREGVCPCPEAEGFHFIRLTKTIVTIVTIKTQKCVTIKTQKNMKGNTTTKENNFPEIGLCLKEMYEIPDKEF